METPAENKKTASPSNKVVIIVAAIIVVIALAVAAFALLRGGGGQAGGAPTIGYAADAEVMLDEDSLQAAVDEALENAKNGMVALQYQNDAYSTDGKTFSCYIANDPANLYDMFLTIYADTTLTDQLFLSGLIPPGSGFEEITLDRALEAGDHTVCVAVTQVETDESGAQTIVNQVMHTVEFHVQQP